MNAVFQLLVPVAASLMLLALGLTLEAAQLRHVVGHPRALLVGSVVRWVMVPAIAIGLCLLVRPPEPIAVGLILVACCPVGTPLPALARASRADVPLGLALTTATNLASPLTLPVLMAVGSALLGFQASLRPEALGNSSLRIGAVVIIPTALGMAIRRARPELARRIEPWVTPFAVLMIAVVVTVLLISSRRQVATSLVQSGALALVMNLVSVGGAALVARLFRLRREELVVVILGGGLFSFGLHAFVGLTLLGDERVLLPGVAYVLLKWGSVMGITAWSRRAGPGAAGPLPLAEERGAL